MNLTLVEKKLNVVKTHMEQAARELRTMDAMELEPPTDANVDGLTASVLDAKEEAQDAIDALYEYHDDEEVTA